MISTFAIPRLRIHGAFGSDQELSSFTEAHELLSAHGLQACPTVVRALVTGCQGDPQAVVETAERLNADQRAGARALPDPLPLVPAVTQRFAHLRLAAWERRVLLCAAVCVDDRIEVLLQFSGRSVEDVIESELSNLLLLVAGRFVFVDERVRSWVHENSSLAERTDVHDALRHVYDQRQDASRALWHRSLSSMAGDPTLTEPLLAFGAQVLERGDAESAYSIAREAASHSDAEHLDAARVLAGRAAVSGGWMADALDWLGPVVGRGVATSHAEALVSYVVAATLRYGSVAQGDVTQNRPAQGAAGRWREYGRAAAAAAVLASERRAKTAARTWLAVTREADAVAGAGGAIREPAVAWSALLLGEERETDLELRDGMFSTAYCAVHKAIDGDIDGGLQLLVQHESAQSAKGITAVDRTPLGRAYLVIAESLLRLWIGDVTAAHEVLREGADRLPLSLPFGGLGVVLARRLELIIEGVGGSLSASLGAGILLSQSQDRLVDRGIESYLRGLVDEASVHMRLWAERGAPGPTLGVLTLDEVGPIDTPDRVEPPDIARARAVRLGVRAARENSWMHDYQNAADESRHIVSPLERGRVEALLGIACVTRGDRGAGQRHLRAAHSLFTEAGANAWRSAIEVRLARLGEQLSASVSVPTVPIPVLGGAGPLARCRAAWEPLLTERELATAMLVAEGCTNREIAARLMVSVRTVEVHIGRLFNKFDVRTRGELTALAHRTDQHA